MNRDELTALFLAVRYAFRYGDREFVISPQDYNPAIDVFAPSWAFLSAENPDSRSAPVAANAVSTAALRAAFGTLQYFEGSGGLGPWKESSFLLLSVSFEDALALARRFNQTAFLFGERGEKARLIFAT